MVWVWVSSVKELQSQIVQILCNLMSLQVSGDLVSIDKKLQDYMAAWDAYVDAWLVVKVGTPEWVQRWRLQAEHAMRDSGKPGMTDEQVVAKPFMACSSSQTSESMKTSVIRVQVLQVVLVEAYALRRLSRIYHTTTIAVIAQSNTCGFQ